MDVDGCGQAHRLDLERVGRQLEQRLHPGVAGELGVGRLVADDAVGAGGAHHEVGQAVEATVEERGLEHHLRALLQGEPGVVVRAFELGAALGAGLRDLDHAAGRRRCRARRMSCCEHRVLVAQAEGGGPGEELVGRDHQPLDQAGLLGAALQQLVLAAQRRDQIRRAGHPDAIELEHQTECPTGV